MRPFHSLLLLALAGCAPAPAALPAGRDIDVEGYETYTTQHNGYSRVRRSYATAADAPIVAAFEDADPADPAGYRDLIDLAGTPYEGRMTVEVLAQVDGPGGTATRLIRLTTDQQPFNNLDGGQLIAATGRFYLRGANYAWVTIDDGPLLQGSDESGLVNMVIDFDTETVSLNLRTGVGGDSQVRLEIEAQDIPLNIRTGAYGDAIVIRVWDPDSADILSVDGTLRGALGGTPEYTDGISDLTTSGLYNADGIDPVTGRRLHVDGAFVGVDPNALADH
ncbi:MAG: viral aspartic protease [Rhodobacteraceae bacterium]|nr:viral aspartic protease [Paracoccaceae bacterium]